MSVALLRRTLENLERWIEQFDAAGSPSGAATSLRNRARLIESHLAQGNHCHKAILQTTADLLDDWAEYVDPASRIRKELSEAAAEIETSLRRIEETGQSAQAQPQKIEEPHGDCHEEESCREEESPRQEEAGALAGTQAVQGTD